MLSSRSLVLAAGLVAMAVPVAGAQSAASTRAAV
jgi:hypothetical protein